MKEYTHSKRIYVPRKTITDLLEKCDDDSDVWSVLFATGLTLAIKPTTHAERDFYREEMKMRAEIQKLKNTESA